MTIASWAETLRRRHHRLAADEGFTLAELLVSITIMGLILVVLIGVQLSALSTVTASKQRQQATALATRTMEQLRALPYDKVTVGLRDTDIAGDPNIAGGLFRPTYNAAINDTLVTSTAQDTSPLFPHVQTGAATLIGNVQYTVRTYVSLVNNSSVNGYWLTAIASWSTNVSRGAKSIAVRSRLFSPTGCLSTATHPFSGPCQAFLYGTGGTTSAGINVAATTDGAPIVTGIPATKAAVSLPQLSSDVQVEQTTTGIARATTSGTSLIEATPSQSGGNATTTQADNDPSSVDVALPAAVTTVGQSGSGRTSSGATGTLALSQGASDSATSFATIAAAASPVCADLTPTALATGQVCAATTSTFPSGAGSATLDLATLAGRDLAPMTLASIAPSATVNRAFAARFTSGSAGHCLTTTSPGCTASGASRGFGTAAVGGLPPASGGDVIPAGFNPTTGMATITGYADRATAESGTAAGTPAATRTAGSLSYWNGTGYTSLSLTPSTAVSVTLPAVTATYRVSGIDNTVISVSGSVTMGATSIVTRGSTPCLAAACGVRAVAPAPVVSLTYSIWRLGIPVASFVTTLDLGSARASTTYKAPPSA